MQSGGRNVMPRRGTRRLSSSQVDPLGEDRGLFSRPPTQVRVDLTPDISANARGDLVIKGFVASGTAIEIVIAGRRRRLAEPLIMTLQHLWCKANECSIASIDPPDAENVRMPALVFGSWRAAATGARPRDRILHGLAVHSSR